MTNHSANDVQQPSGRHVDSPNGRIFLTEVPGEAPPIVLMHGFPDDHRIYNKLLPALFPRRAVAFDFVGYGRSERIDGADFSTETHSAEITAVLDALDIERAVLVGHDASGPDVVLYSLANPQRVAHLVLLNTVFGNRPSMKLPEMIQLFADTKLQTLADDMVGDPKQLLWLLQRQGMRWGLDANDPEGIVRNSILPQFYGDEYQPNAVASIRAWCARLHGELDQQDKMVGNGFLEHLEIPVSIIWGGKDSYLNPSLATEIASLFPKPFIYLLPDGGHWPQHDRPHEVAELLKRCETA